MTEEQREKQRAYNRAYYHRMTEAQKEKARACHRAYYHRMTEAQRVRLRVQNRKWARANREKQLAYNKRYKNEHLEKCMEWASTHQSIKSFADWIEQTAIDREYIEQMENVIEFDDSQYLKKIYEAKQEYDLCK